jgi:hypothetical protein
MKFVRLSLVFVIMGIMGALISVRAQDKPARTYYESLALDTPEAAVKTFAAAFAKEDFPTVFMVFAPKAQQVWQKLYATFNIDHMVKPDYGKQALQNLPAYDQWESLEPSYIFDTIMLDAVRHDALLIDLRGDMVIGKSSKSETNDGDEAVDVAATIDGIKGDVIFRLVQSPSKRWRILQVIVSDGDESNIPWSVASSSKS